MSAGARCRDDATRPATGRVTKNSSAPATDSERARVSGSNAQRMRATTVPLTAMTTRLRYLLLLAMAWMSGAYGATGMPLPLAHDGGTWDSGHVQGIAVDPQGGYIYYSFTDMLAKYRFDGSLVGTLGGWTGHLGDLDFNPHDGKVYGSIEYKAQHAFYVAVIDVARVDRPGMDARGTDIVRAVYLPEVVRDYAGQGAGGRPHRYGCSGIDGIGFGPEFGRAEGPHLLTVAYGIHGDRTRTDNDHQILLQYDIAGWPAHARPLDEAALHRNAPAAARGKHFVRTGNTEWGVQNLAYDDASRRWFLGVYPGRKPRFPNYTLFAVDAHSVPATGELVGVPAEDADGWARGSLLPLAEDGLADAGSGIRGWYQKADVGFQPVGGGLFYLAENAERDGRQSARLRLMRWRDDPDAPFVPAGRDARTP